MRRLALLAAYTAIVLFRPGPASGAEVAAVANIHSGFVDRDGLTQAQLDVACGNGKVLLPQGLKFHTCK
jgi:hypothetical protein